MPAYPCCNNFTFPGTCGLCSDGLPSTLVVDLTGTPITTDGVACSSAQCAAYQKLYVCDPVEIITAGSSVFAVYRNSSPGVCNLDSVTARLECRTVAETWGLDAIFQFTNNPLNTNAWSSGQTSYAGSPITCANIDETFQFNGGASPSGGCSFDGEDIRIYATA